MIELRGLTRHYGSLTAVDHVDLDIREGEKHALIGTSGSGKTTLLKMINKLVEKSEGQIRIDNVDTDQWDPVKLRRSLGYIIQGVGLFPHYTIEENIALIPRMLKWEKQKVRTRVLEVLGMVGLEEGYLSLYPDALSGGQKQRVGIARSIAANPATILMDEPFGALDPITRSVMQQEFLKLPGIAKKTTILVTHDMLEAAMLAERITILDQGRVQQTGSLSDLLFNPHNEFVSNFLSHQRSELELRAIPVTSLIPFLSPTEDSDNQHTVIPPETSLELLEPTGNVALHWKDKVYITNRSSCLSLYYKHRVEIIQALKK